MCWHCREAKRFVSGEYKHVPWRAEPWALSKSETAYHWVHVSRHDPSLVAYTASEEHGEADRQTRIAPGRYLTRFYGDVLAQKDIQYWCGRFKGEHQEEIALKFASEPDEIAWVYENGPSSCMAGSADGFASDPVHPASVYGAGDLAVAYLVNEGKVTARAICWPAKQIFGRVYGDDCTLYTKLEAAGYTRGSTHEFDGARLLRIECDHGLVCPYLDVGSDRRVEDNGEYLIVGEGHMLANDTHGVVNQGTLCPCCEEYYNGGNGRYVTDVDEYWCESCASDTSHCDSCGNRYTDGHLTRVLSDDHVCERCLDRHYTYCEVCEEYHHYNDDPCESEEEEEQEFGSPTITDDARQGAFL